MKGQPVTKYSVSTGKGDFLVDDRSGGMEAGNGHFLRKRAIVLADEIAKALGSKFGRVTGGGNYPLLVYGRPGGSGMTVDGETTIYSVEPVKP